MFFYDSAVIIYAACALAGGVMILGTLLYAIWHIILYYWRNR